MLTRPAFFLLAVGIICSLRVQIKAEITPEEADEWMTLYKEVLNSGLKEGLKCITSTESLILKYMVPVAGKTKEQVQSLGDSKRLELDV